jgi:trk system potassium uptake protein TrkH
MGRQVAGTFGLAPVLHFVGIILCCLGMVMLIPAVVDLADSSPDYQAFVVSGAVTFFTGVSLTLGFAGESLRIGLRQSVLAVLFTWLGAAVFGSLPFLFAANPLSFTDAVFETVSGLSATGSTIYLGLDHASYGILLWRFLLIWVGASGS